ncbi:prolyl-tRNA synthetase [Candidatus Tremblaya phenacola PAVE]|nr:prolyl-tRNA synthetase [Candidatus Tremblaya phenacola PAVE]
MKATQFSIKSFTAIKMEEADHNICLLAKMGLAHQVCSGIHCFLPMGLRIIHRISYLIRHHMNSIGSLEVKLPILQPFNLWQRSGRALKFGAELLSLMDRTQTKYILAPTSEELVVTILGQYAFSYNQLPIFLYQIQPKFRDEIRPRSGTIRSKEFVMKDSYSFDKTERCGIYSYQLMSKTYKMIFSGLSLKFRKSPADSGQMGGGTSHEFLAFTPINTGQALSPLIRPALPFKTKREESVWFDAGWVSTTKQQDYKMPLTTIRGLMPNSMGLGNRNLSETEVGHIFQLGRYYSSELGASFKGKDGNDVPMVLGCYGIGVSRILSVILNQKGNDEEAMMCWPPVISPFALVLIYHPVRCFQAQIRSLTNKLYSALKLVGDVILENRHNHISIATEEWDFIGVTNQMVVGVCSIKNKLLVLQNKRRGGLCAVPILSILEGLIFCPER